MRNFGDAPPSLAAIAPLLANRRLRAQAIIEDASKKSTKAGYDAAGMSVGCVTADDVMGLLRGANASGNDAADHELSTRSSRLGGDLLKTWPTLLVELGLDELDLVTAWQSHVRQASQGDMYSGTNAHPQWEELSDDSIALCTTDAAGELLFSPQTAIGRKSLFYTSHNGDINDAAEYKRLLSNVGFVFHSNSDSCVVPAVQRFLLEQLTAGRLAAGLQYLSIGTADHPGVLASDHHGTAQAKLQTLLELAHSLESKYGAGSALIVTVLAARLFEYSNKESKFVFQTFSPLGRPSSEYLGGGTQVLVRGGSGCGGEEGGELVLHIPRSCDRQNFGLVAVAAASEENALKGQFALLDADLLERHSFGLATERVFDLPSVDGLLARGHMTEGVLPVYDVLPGEAVEIDADARIRIFDIYGPRQVCLQALDEQWTAGPQRASQREVRRQERVASLKVFRVVYSNADGVEVPPPLNKYGEEIRVVQPLALRLNTEKLFSRSDTGARLRPNLNLTFGTEDDEVRDARIRSLKHIILGGAGTSTLINSAAAAIARKLHLHSLPTVVLDAFTGSDTIPAYVSGDTLFIANSNSGGTADTIRLTQQMASLSGVLERLEGEVARRDGDSAEVQRLSALLHEIRAQRTAADGGTLELPDNTQSSLADRIPWVYVVTNIEASALGGIGRGLDPLISKPAGAGVTNLPEEECVGSTFAAIASFQWQIALHTYLGEVRGEISSQYAEQVYAELERLADVVRHVVNDESLLQSIRAMANELVGGNHDFVYTGYVDGVPDEQAHKGAEMIQEMFAGWNFFQFQHGKYAQMKRRTRFALGSVLGHNVPPPQWHFFNARGLKAPKEIGPRVGNTFVLAHESDATKLRQTPGYPPDYVFTYPADSIVLFPVQAIVISQLISYIWGDEKARIGAEIADWNAKFVDLLLSIPRTADQCSPGQRSAASTHARAALRGLSGLAEQTPHLDNVELRRFLRVTQLLSFVAEESSMDSAAIEVGGFLGSSRFAVDPVSDNASTISDAMFLAIVKDIAVELSTSDQARRIADHFLVDESGKVSSDTFTVDRAGRHTKTTNEYDYWGEYEGIGALYDVEPVHPPKIAKAKKGWL